VPTSSEVQRALHPECASLAACTHVCPKTPAYSLRSGSSLPSHHTSDCAARVRRITAGRWCPSLLRKLEAVHDDVVLMKCDAVRIIQNTGRHVRRDAFGVSVRSIHASRSSPAKVQCLAHAAGTVTKPLDVQAAICVRFEYFCQRRMATGLGAVRLQGRLRWPTCPLQRDALHLTPRMLTASGSTTH
jgi:hypothetical protein